MIFRLNMNHGVTQALYMPVLIKLNIKTGRLIGADLEPSLGERKKMSRPKFSEWPFLRKNFHFTAQNFWRPFLVIDYCLSFCLFSVFTVLNLIFNTGYIIIFLTKILIKNLDFRQKSSSLTSFFVSLYFASHPLTVLFKILGERIHGTSPTTKFGGPSPQSHLSLRPWVCYCKRTNNTNYQQNKNGHYGR